MLAGCLTCLRLKGHDLGVRLLRCLLGFFRFFGFSGLGAAHLHCQIHGLLRKLFGLLKFTSGQRITRLALQLNDLAFAVFRGLKLRHALTAQLTDFFLRGHRQQPLGFFDALNFYQMPIGFSIERIYVSTVFRGGGDHGLAFGGQYLVFDSDNVGAAFSLGQALA